jgi:hypothetical protein
VILLWPVAVAIAALRDDRDLPAWTRAALYTAMSLMVLKPLIPDRNAQRLLQVLGVDFIATSLLAAGLMGKCLRKPTHSTTATPQEDLVTSLHIGSPATTSNTR